MTKKVESITLEELSATTGVEATFIKEAEVKDDSGRSMRCYVFGANGCGVKQMGHDMKADGFIYIDAAMGAGAAGDMAQQILNDTIKSYQDYQRSLKPELSITVVENGRTHEHICR